MVATANRVAAHINGNGRHSINGKPAHNGTNALGKPLDSVCDGKSEQRTPSGQFAPGNKCGKGNPYARKMASMRKAFADVVDESRLRQLAEKLYQQSLTGDTMAAKLLLSYIVGKPVEVVNPDTLDLEEWRLVEQCPTMAEMVALENNSVKPTVAKELVEFTQPQDMKSQIKHVQKKLKSNGRAFVRDVTLARERRR